MKVSETKRRRITDRLRERENTDNELLVVSISNVKFSEGL